ncbi:ribonuclease HI family protein [Sporosarcina koreensis]|uniref:ribonuclease HI family protein n=1 Tax=Sporosarcina koreensis TaxID=334735 RepID=UPI00058E7E8D|nr:ribonuclease HI family protein [Sporosarcina koreensis]
MIELYTDGASAGNPGVSGIGIYLTGEGHSVKLSEPIPPCDNHTAEFQALIRGLEEAASLTDGMLSVRSDSQLVVQAVEKEFVKNPEYHPYLQQVLRLTSHFEYFFIKWIPDSSNRAADALAREAIQRQKNG